MYNPIFTLTDIFCVDSLYRQKLKTQMQISRLEKVNISYTGKNLISNATELCYTHAALTYITGQRCTVLWARQSISSWKLRKNSVIGCKVTLRGRSAFYFLEKLYIYGALRSTYFFSCFCPCNTDKSKNLNYYAKSKTPLPVESDLSPDVNTDVTDIFAFVSLDASDPAKVAKQQSKTSYNKKLCRAANKSIPLLNEKSVFHKRTYSFGIHNTFYFFELQKSFINWKSFSGFYISIR